MIGITSISFETMILVGGILFGLILVGVLTFYMTSSYFRTKMGVVLSRRKESAYIQCDDEFGQLAREFQRLDQTQAKASDDARKLQHDLDGLLKISEASSISSTLDNIYQHILDVVQEVTGFSYGGIGLVEPNGKFVYVVATKSVPDSVLRYIEIEDFEKEYMRPLKEARAPYYIYDMQSDPREVPEIIIKLGYRAVLKTPLLSGERLIGVLTISKKEPYEWPLEELRWMAAVGRQLGILIDHIRISEHLQNVAVLTEREWISQELHDNFSQFIGTIRLLAERVIANCEKRDYANVMNDVEDIEKIARNAYASLRDEMYGLRMIGEPDQELISTVQKFLDRFHLQWSIETTFEIKDIHEPYFVSAIISIQLLRIIQETLANISQHAQATRVDVSLQEVNDRLLVEIIDNGIGFNPDSDFDNSYGLKIIHERATSLGGSLKITSALHSGTIVRVELPKIVTKSGSQGVLG
jgi:signal transduction histidine kinase